MTENTGADDVIITLPVERPNVELPVIELIYETQLYVKRIIGMPKDTIQLKDGIVYINNKAIEEKGKRIAPVERPNVELPVIELILE